MKTLFLIYSPFQAVCTYEAMAKFDIQSADIICLGGNFLKKNSKTPCLLNELELPYRIIEPESYIDTLLHYFKLSNQYDRCFIGDFFIPYLRLLASIMLKNGGELYYLDDGASTITATTNKHPLMLSPWRVKIHYIAPLLLSFFKGHKGEFFSIFETNKGLKNELMSIRKRYPLSNYNPQGIFIIGTTYKGFNEPETFLPLLRKTIERFKEPDQIMYYSPHRAAINDEAIASICSQNNVKYIIGDYCVEVDYIKREYNPKIIIGFGSTALFSLRKIYPRAFMCSVKYPSVMVKGNEKVYSDVNDKLQKAGIEIITILD